MFILQNSFVNDIERAAKNAIPPAGQGALYDPSISEPRPQGALHPAGRFFPTTANASQMAITAAKKASIEPMKPIPADTFE
jgi:hypothetical protein